MALPVPERDLTYVRVNHQARLQFGEELDFESGAQISVPASHAFEAWSVVGPGRTLVVCVPGATGDVSVWTDSGQ